MESWLTFSSGLPLFLCSVAAVILYRFLTSASFSKKLPPGPSGFKAFCGIVSAIKDGDLYKPAEIWSKQYGDVVLCRTPIFGDICFISKARLMKELFASKEREMVTNDRPPIFTLQYLFFGDKSVAGASVSSDPHFSGRKRLISSTIKFYGDGVDKFESTARAELQRLTSRIETTAGEEVDMHSLCSYSLLCILNVLITGECPDPDSPSVQAMEEFNSATNEMLNAGTEAALVSLPFLRFIPGTYFKDLCRRGLITRDAALKHLYEDVKDTRVPGQPRGMVDYLLDEKEKAENFWVKEDDVRGVVLNIFSAAYLVLLGLLRAVFLILAHHPDIVRKIQQDIDAVLGQTTPCVEDKRKLPYAEAVIWETIRYSAYVPFVDPHYVCQDVDIDGYTIPKGTTVHSFFRLISRDPEVFDDPDLFRPERFLDDAGQLLPSSHPRIRSTALIFGVGKRLCPGESFGRSRAFLYVTTLLQKFDILPPVTSTLPPPNPESFCQDGPVVMPRPHSLIFRRRN